MFCYNCGNKIDDNAEFCSKCGKKVGDVNASINQSSNTVSSKEKKDNRRILLIAAIIVCSLLIIVLVIIKIFGNEENQNHKEQTESYEQSAGDEDGKRTEEAKGGFDSYEEAIDVYYNAAFIKDVKGVVACYPDEMQGNMRNLYDRYSGGDYFGDQAVFRFMTEADGNEYSYELGDVAAMNTDELAQIESKYDISLDEAYTVETSLSCRYLQEYMSEYVKETTSAPLKVAKIGKKWFLIEGTAEWMWQQQ